MVQDAGRAPNLSAVKLALLARQLRENVNGFEALAAEPIAVIGMGCRFPGGVRSPQDFWELLAWGVDAVTEVPKDRWNAEALFDADPDAVGRLSTRWGGFLDGVDRFDPAFFGIAPREAQSMDPQQRLLLEVAWEALEDAHQVPGELLGSDTGVFVGVYQSDYFWEQLKTPERLDLYALSGSSHSIAANRISYVLNFKGPSLAVDSACSASLVSIHLACQSLRQRECRLALAGGVNLMLSPLSTMPHCRGHVMAADGRCKTFDARADGFVRGEGCGLVVLKLLSDALTDGDAVLAVVRGSAVNQDGRTTGLTAPNGLAQQDVIRKALENAGLEAAQIGLVEAHGTGTALGDPIEMEALAAVYGAPRAGGETCAVGSVKTNVGHLEAAAGVAGFMKAVLSLSHRAIPPHLHFETPNPHISFANTPFAIPRRLMPWDVPRGRTRLAAVSAFGFGGTNAHAVLEEAPDLRASAARDADATAQLLVLSSRTTDALPALARRFAARLIEKDASTSWPDLCATAASCRTHFEHRLALVAPSASMAADLLLEFASSPSTETTSWTNARPGLPSPIQRGRTRAAEPVGPRIAFVFTGQGSQFVNMGRTLFETEPHFRETLESCASILASKLPLPLLSVLFPEDPAATSSALDQTGFAQPALFALEYALARLWESWGITPDAVMGHSVGEFVAACVAGVLSLKDAVSLVAERGRLMQALPSGGAMAAVFASESRLGQVLGERPLGVSLAAVNGPGETVLSGSEPALDAALKILAREGIGFQKLRVSHAFHSAAMEPMLEPFERAAREVPWAGPRIPLVANGTGRFAEPGSLGPESVRRHARETVQFQRSVETLQSDGFRIFLEVGPQAVLCGLGRRCAPDALWLPSLRREVADREALLTSLAALHVEGARASWEGLFGKRSRRIALPLTQFERQGYWLDPSETDARSPREAARGNHPLLGAEVALSLPQRVFSMTLSAEAPAFLSEHRVNGAVVVPATAFLEMGLAAARAVDSTSNRNVRGLALSTPLVIPMAGARSVQVVLTPEDQEGHLFEVFSRDAAGGGPWIRHATGRLVVETLAGESVSIAALRDRCVTATDVESLRLGIGGRGVDLGPSFGAIRELWRGDGEALARLEAPETVLADAGAYLIHPAILDAALQPLAVLLHDEGTYLPFGLERFAIERAAPRSLFSHVRLRESDAGTKDQAIVDVRLFDESGSVVASLDGLALRRAAIPVETSVDPECWFHEIMWRPSSIGGESSPAGGWLVFADEAGLGAELAARLIGSGAACRVVTSGSLFERTESGFQVNPDRREDFDRLFDSVRTDGSFGALSGIVLLWGADRNGMDPEVTLLRGGGATLHLVKAIAAAKLPSVPRLWLGLHGACAVDGAAPSAGALLSSTLRGFARTLVLEKPELRSVLVDLDPAAELASDANVAALWSEIGASDREDEVAWRGGVRLVPRLVLRPADAVSKVSIPSGSFRLTSRSRGDLDSLEFVEAARRSPGASEVEIEVACAGLNFRDVLNALALDEERPFGVECAGIVVTIGSDVDHLRPGQRVFGLAPGSLGRFVTTSAELVVPVPSILSNEAAAAIPVAFLTAEVALFQLEELRRGERVLIHAAAGGVGLAAVRLAIRAGAEVFATASPAKWPVLEELGVRHLASSRDTRFVETFGKEAGEGVDVVLNALTDEFIPAGLSLLRPGGRFIEMGRRGIWTHDQVRAVRPDVRYEVLELGVLAREQGPLIQGLLLRLAADFSSGALMPLPIRTFESGFVREAFRTLSQARNIGKIVVDLAPVSLLPRPLALRHDATYLVTGGLSGLGLHVARWMVARGARSLVLVGRSEPSTEALALVSELESSGARVVVERVDVGDALALGSVFSRIANLRGVIHAAGVLEEGVLEHQTWERFARVMRPKVAGALHLHELTRTLPIDFFVLFSSAASLLGSAGQSGYGAANSFLDVLAQHRRARGLPAISLCWGGWAGSGMAAELEEHDVRRWTARGMRMIPVEQGLAALERAIQLGSGLNPQSGVLPIDWNRYAESFGSAGVPPLLGELIRKRAASAAAPSEASRPAAGDDFLLRLRGALASERTAIAIAHLRAELERVLGLDPSRPIEVTLGFHDAGMDSLTAIEFRNRLQAGLGRPLASTVAFDHPNLEALSRFVIDSVFSVEPSDRNGSREKRSEGALPEDMDGLLAEIEGLSELETTRGLRRS